jgi:hypothetical protein
MGSVRWGLLPLFLALAGCAATGADEPALRREIAGLRAQLQLAREQANANKLSCSALERERAVALGSARQLRADTQYLRASATKMSDAVTRLSYEDWDKVVPEVQLAFTDVEAASQDLDARVGRVLIALHADTDSNK